MFGDRVTYQQAIGYAHLRRLRGVPGGEDQRTSRRCSEISANRGGGKGRDTAPLLDKVGSPLGAYPSSRSIGAVELGGRGWDGREGGYAPLESESPTVRGNFAQIRAGAALGAPAT